MYISNYLNMNMHVFNASLVMDEQINVGLDTKNRMSGIFSVTKIRSIQQEQEQTEQQ